MPPTVPHLTALMEKMKQNNCNILLSVPYFDLKQIQFFIREANVRQVRMANLPESQEGTSTHLDWMRYNAAVLLETLETE